MRIIQQRKTRWGTTIYHTDQNVAFVCDPNPTDERGRPIPGRQRVDAHALDTDHQIGAALMPAGTPIGKWLPIIRAAGGRVDREPRR